MVADLLDKTLGLEKFVFRVPEYHLEPFEKAFHQTKILIPNLKDLVVGPYCDFFVAICPNVNNISSNGLQWLHSGRARKGEEIREESMRLIKAAGTASKLQHFQIKEWWTLPLVKGERSIVYPMFACSLTFLALLEAVPGIPSLAMEGGEFGDPIYVKLKQSPRTVSVVKLS